jgi:hypothetical protein
MAKLLFVRIAGGAGIVSLAFLFVGLIPFLSADPSASAVLAGRTSSFSVNHEFKGDRLPVSEFNWTALRAQRYPQEIPVGCDPSFSPISAPRLAYIYGRCTT